MRNLHADPAHAATVASLKEELRRLKGEVRDEDQFAAEQPPGGVDGPFPDKKPIPAPGKSPGAKG
jgi:hypothetical protein